MLSHQADISLRLKESTALLDAVLALQPRDANAPAGQRPDDVVLAVTQELVSRIPGGLKHRKVCWLCTPQFFRAWRLLVPDFSVTRPPRDMLASTIVGLK